MSFFDSKPANRRLHHQMKGEQAAAPTAHKPKVPSISRQEDMVPPHGVPKIHHTVPNDINEYTFVDTFIQKFPHPNKPGEYLRGIVANMSREVVGEGGAKSVTEMPFAATDLMHHKEGPAIVKALNDQYRSYVQKNAGKNLAQKNAPHTKVAMAQPTSNAMAQHARVAKAAPQHQQKPSLLAQLSKKFSLSA